MTDTTDTEIECVNCGCDLIRQRMICGECGHEQYTGSDTTNDH